MEDKDYFLHLYEIASHLNKEFSLHSTLQKSLEKTVEILDLETGWFWLTEPDNRSVFLAASYNLPPALRNHPERLSGWCYCIKQYLADDLDQAMNISEITCSRLKDINSGTKGLRFHAIIPIIIKNQKVGLMNLLSKESRQLSEKELAILNTISELIGSAIQRTRLQEAYGLGEMESDHLLSKAIEGVFKPQVEALISCLDIPSGASRTEDALIIAKDLQQQLRQLSKEVSNAKRAVAKKKTFSYPNLPLTKRELEVLVLVKKGLTNDQIGKHLFITERTVKFHLTAILSKLDAKTRTEAVDIAHKRGFLSS